MTELKIFANPVFGQIRTVRKNNAPWFVAIDVCRALEISNNRDALTRLDDDEKNTVALTDGTPGNPNVTIVNEPGLYALVLGSRKPEARAFKRWITHEVIPDIRKHGMYASDATISDMLDDPDQLITILTRYRDERHRRKALESKVMMDAPKVLFADSVETSHQSILIGELAKMMKQNGVNIGQNRLFQKLRDEGFLCSGGERRNMPTQRAMEMKLFDVKERCINNPDGSVRLTLTTKITGKGQIYFMNRYRAEVQRELQ